MSFSQNDLVIILNYHKSEIWMLTAEKLKIRIFLSSWNLKLNLENCNLNENLYLNDNFDNFDRKKFIYLKLNATTK